MTAPKRGDWVKVVIEGVVGPLGPKGFWVGGDSPDANYIVRAAEHVVSVEVLPPPEPAWWPPKCGDVIRVWGSTYLRREVDEGETGFNDWVNGAGMRLFDDALLAEIQKGHDQDYGYPQPALLVRGGKPVGA